jgi:hypothetical protein
LGRTFLREEDFIVRRGQIAAARQWYESQGYPKSGGSKV